MTRLCFENAYCTVGKRYSGTKDQIHSILFFPLRHVIARRVNELLPSSLAMKDSAARHSCLLPEVLHINAQVVLRITVSVLDGDVCC